MKKKINIGVVGATGYTGELIVDLLLKHPNTKIAFLGSESYSGKYYHQVLPQFKNKIKLKCKKNNAEEIAKSCDLVFLATPNKFAKDFVPKLLETNPNIKVIDLSADFRIDKKNKTLVAYGLPELYRKQIKSAQIVANPGCYPTSILLGLIPIIKKNLIKPNSIISDSKSGVSGAGRNAKKEIKAAKSEEAFSPYKLGGIHTHIPEIEQEIKKLSKTYKKSTITFSPHLLPIDRGIISTIYADIKGEKITQKKLTNIYKAAYKNEKFIKILEPNTYPDVKDVNGTNLCLICPVLDERTNRIIIVSCIDNMVKGASGQAIQNMNIMLGVNEKTALTN